MELWYFTVTNSDRFILLPFKNVLSQGLGGPDILRPVRKGMRDEKKEMKSF